MTGLAGVVANGSRAASLRALRDLLGETIDTAEPQHRAQLAKQLRETMAELDALPDAETQSTSDDLARRRQDRLAATKAAPGPGRSGVDLGEGSG